MSATELLVQAFTGAAQLPEAEQEMIAALILKEIDSERRWNQLFSESRDALVELVNEALVAHRAGKTKRLDLDKL
ncbi:MAG TPA: hypothetical protein VK879_16970 [Candidatus Sulfomarinibacteraceae bacterium]|nr:hypothetical protein [Candidatus Sulfomarinibacteraceae bacterium]